MCGVSASQRSLNIVKDSERDSMASNRNIVVLLTLVILMQGGIMYKQGVFSQPPPLLQQVRDAPDGAWIDIAGMPVEGSTDAELVLIEFSDYECPFCQRHAAGVRRELLAKYVETGQIRYVFANNPLPIHPNARFMAATAICAGEQGRYWEMHDAVFDAQPTSRDLAITLAANLGIEEEVFRQCLDESPEPAARIQADVEKAQEFGLTGTPGFALGAMDQEGRVRVRRLIHGAQSFSVFDKTITALFDDGAEF
jgi:protein-disulfide isomerase